MNFEEVRKLTITALFSDDFLSEQLVLKGGNAMNLILRISPRVSLDLDFSMESDFENLEEVRTRIGKALASRFSTVGFIPFDVKLAAKPSIPPTLTWWGGYELNFKLIDEDRHRAFGLDQERLRREAFVLGPKQQSSHRLRASPSWGRERFGCASLYRLGQPRPNGLPGSENLVSSSRLTLLVLVHTRSGGLELLDPAWRGERRYRRIVTAP
jgi:hypothetical protein